jgi:predicted transcriptional regulator
MTTCTLLAMPTRKPTEEKKSATVSTRVAATELAELEQMAQADDRTVSYLIAKAIREFLERHASAKKRR